MLNYSVAELRLKSKIDYFINRFWRALIPNKSIPLTNKEPQNAINLFSFFYMHFPNIGLIIE